jgi:hypothetical protein
MRTLHENVIARTLRGDRCLCRTCGEYFNSTAAFDKHRVGPYDLKAPHYGRRCRTPDEMRAAGMAPNPDGWWTTDARKRAPWALASRATGEQSPEPVPQEGSGPNPQQATDRHGASA